LVERPAQVVLGGVFGRLEAVGWPHGQYLPGHLHPAGCVRLRRAKPDFPDVGIFDCRDEPLLHHEVHQERELAGQPVGLVVLVEIGVRLRPVRPFRWWVLVLVLVFMLVSALVLVLVVMPVLVVGNWVGHPGDARVGQQSVYVVAAASDGEVGGAAVLAGPVTDLKGRAAGGPFVCRVHRSRVRADQVDREGSPQVVLDRCLLVAVRVQHDPALLREDRRIPLLRAECQAREVAVHPSSLGDVADADVGAGG
jgi:hypothetical protein